MNGGGGDASTSMASAAAANTAGGGRPSLAYDEVDDTALITYATEARVAESYNNNRGAVEPPAYYQAPPPPPPQQHQPQQRQARFVVDPSSSRGTYLVDRHGQAVSVERWLNTRPLRSEVSHRPGPGNRKIHYFSGEQVTRHLNEVFGYDGWNLDIKSVTQTSKTQISSGQQKWTVSYLSHVRITIVPHHTTTSTTNNAAPPQVGTYREDYGAGDSTDKSLQTAVAHAMKASITDALKRAARHFGDRLGNSLYDSSFKMSTAPLTLHQALDDYDKEQAKKCPKYISQPNQQQQQQNQQQQQQNQQQASSSSNNSNSKMASTATTTPAAASWQQRGNGGTGPAQGATKTPCPTVTPASMAPTTGPARQSQQNTSGSTLQHQQQPPPPPFQNRSKPYNNASSAQNKNGRQQQNQQQQHQPPTQSGTTGGGPNISNRSTNVYAPPAMNRSNNPAASSSSNNNNNNSVHWKPGAVSSSSSSNHPNATTAMMTGGSQMDPPRTAAQAMQSLFSDPSTQNNNENVSGNAGGWNNNNNINSLPERPSTATGKRPRTSVSGAATVASTTSTGSENSIPTNNKRANINPYANNNNNNTN